ncbi:MAG: SDR family oxidoreductase [Candidatus Eremiobacteraeota bacterium]|nr:SDR family oxidoreductase [Candidatus Eremiobacteraeota bacterium]
MSANPTLLVAGAGGHLGRRVVELLLDSGATNVVAATRSPEKLADLVARGVTVRRADFDEPASLPAAFAGADRMLLISTDALGIPGRRLAQHRAAIDAAVRAGVQHVVYTSMPNPDPDSPINFAPDHRGTEEALEASGLGYTVLRNNWYTDLLLAGVPAALASGKLVGAAGDGGAAYIARDDCARAAAAALRSTETASRTLNITGPAVVGYAEIAAILSEIGGKPVTYVPVEPAAFEAGLIAHGVPAVYAQISAEADVAKARGRMGPATGEFQALTGTSPTSVRDFLTSSLALQEI